MATLSKRGNLSYWQDPFTPPDESDLFRVSAADEGNDEGSPSPNPTPQPDPTPPDTPPPAGTPPPETPPPTTPDPTSPYDPNVAKVPSAPGGLTFGPNGKFIYSIFNQQGKTPTQHDLDYWENVIVRASGDLDYVRMRMLQPDTGGGGGTTNDPTIRTGRGGNPTIPGGNYTPISQRGANGESLFVGPDGQLYAQGFEGYVRYTGADPRGAGGGGGGTGGGGTGGGGLSDFITELMNRARGLMDRYSQPVTRDDPNIRPLVDAYHGRTARAVATYREKMAERAHAEGVPTGAFDAQVGNADLQAGQSEGGLEAELMNRENESRRQALLSMFGGASSLGLGDKGLDIQDFLGRGSLSNQLLLGTGSLANQNLGITNQNRQFYDQLAWLMSQYGNNLDSVLTQLLMGGGR